MLSVRRKSINKYLKIAEISLTNRLAYLSDHLASSLFLLLILFIFAQLWQTILQNGQIAGFNKVQMLWYMVFTEVIVLSTPSTHRAINQEVKSGDIAYKLTRPYSYPLYYFFSHCGEFVVRFITNLAIGGTFAYLMMGPIEIQWQFLGWWMLGLFLAVTIMFLLYFALALLAFWLEDNTPFLWIFSKMTFIFGGLFVPVEAYPEALRLISYILPLRYGVSAPARLAISFDHQFFRQMLTGQVIWVVLLSTIVATMYRKGVKRINVNGG